jgi:hypothetical protein
MNFVSINSWGDTLKVALINVVNFLPQLLAAIIIFIVGLIVARILGRLVEQVINYTRINQLFYRTGVAADVQKTGINFNLGYFLGWIVQFFIIIATLVSVSDMLLLTSISQFLRSVLSYIPNVIVALIILAIGLVAGNMLGDMVSRMTTGSQMSKYTRWLSNIARWAVIVFAIMTALIQLGVATSLIQIIFSGIVIAASLAIGLAFGLGGQERAHDWLEQVSKNTRRGNV